MSIRHKLKHLYLRFLDARFRRAVLEPGSGKAIVFAPHPDDETIGCGGTVLRKAALGSEIFIVYMTDGSMSHQGEGQISPQALAEIRRTEALSACARLGIDAQCVEFLGYRDGQLVESRDEAKARVEQILAAVRPQEVFIPYRKDRHRDHIATNEIVRAAAAAAKSRVAIYEYLVWFWLNWPLVDAQPETGAGRLGIAKLFLRHLVLMLRDVNCSVDISAVIEKKRAALHEHKSQTVRIGGESWFVLTDVAGGEWLELSFRRFEAFHSYSAGGQAGEGDSA